jgi:plastocyanin
MANTKTQHVVEMIDMAFSPQEIQVRIGDTIVWKNADQMEHNAQRDDEPNAFETRLLKFNESSTPIPFAEAGTFEYFCRPHDSFMRATIIVESDKCTNVSK